MKDSSTYPPALLSKTPIAAFDERLFAFQSFIGCSALGARMVLTVRGDVYDASCRRLTEECVEKIHTYLYPKGAPDA